MAQGKIYIRNSDSEDLFVAIKDLNTGGSDVLWDEKRLNEDDTEPLVCEINGGDEAYIEWVATSTIDGSSSSSDTVKVSEGNETEVYAS